MSKKTNKEKQFFCRSGVLPLNQTEWQVGVQNWIQKHYHQKSNVAESVVTFFEKVFSHTRCPKRAWFGVQKTRVSLVIGNLRVAAVHQFGKEKGSWLLLDQELPDIKGIEYCPVPCTQNSPSPLMRAHWPSLETVSNLVTSDNIWNSYAVASEKIFDSPRISADRDASQIKHGKKRLSEFWQTYQPTVNQIKDNQGNLFPDEVEPFYEGSVRKVSVNAYERNSAARAKCIAHYGPSCVACGFNFEATYGGVGEGFIHVHHLRPLHKTGKESQIDPIADLRPVCPNCHAMIHRSDPPYTIEDVQKILDRNTK